MIVQLCTACDERAFFALQDGSVSCSICGHIDNVLTSRANFKETYGGHDLSEAYLAQIVASSQKYQTAAVERRFLETIEARVGSWVCGRTNILGLPWPNPLGSPENNPFVKSVVDIYKAIRHAETERLDEEPGSSRQLNPTINADVRRVQYQLAVSVRLAAVQNNLVLVYNALGEEGRETIPPLCVGRRAVASEILPVPYLEDMSANLARMDDPIPDVKFLTYTYKTFTRKLRRPTDPLYIIMSNCLLVIKRLRTLIKSVETSTVSDPFVSSVKKSHRYYRPWTSGDFDYFREEELVWDKVPVVAYNLYRAQQCVMVWGNTTSYVYAIALTLHAVYGLVGSWYPYNPSLIAELSAQYGTKHFRTVHAYSSLKRFIVAWSTSLPAIGVPVPPLNLPNYGLVGTGHSGWNGDRRRRVPESELLAVTILPVATHWKAIYRSRLRRQKVRSYEVELNNARQLLAANTPDIRQRWLSPKGSSSKTRLLRQYAEDVDISASPASPAASTSASSCAWEIDDEPEIDLVQFASGCATIAPPDPTWFPTVDSAKYVPPEIKERSRREMAELDDLLRDYDSSDDDDGYSSEEDDEDDRPVVRRRRNFQLHRQEEHAGLLTFTFNTKSHAFSAQRYDTACSPPHVELPASFGRDYEPEPSPALTRGQSVESDDSLFEYTRQRSDSPAVSVTTLHSINSVMPSAVAMSRVDTGGRSGPTVLARKVDWTPHASRPAYELGQEKAHIASLIRERDEYVPYSTHRERQSGRMVSRDVEQYLEGWLEKERAKGRIPRKISAAYLESIELRVNPMVERIDSWILAQQYRWTPLECVLRAGIPPKQIPAWMVPHSLTAVVQALEHRRPLPCLPAIPECPPIPDRFKADPITYAAEIRKLKKAWADDVSDDFPVFFATHEKLVLTPAADELFAPGEMDMYLADEAEIRERKRDRTFMQLLEGKEPNERKRKRDAKIEDVGDLDHVSTEFWGYGEALLNDFWAETEVATGQDEDEDDELGIWGEPEVEPEPLRPDASELAIQQEPKTQARKRRKLGTAAPIVLNRAVHPTTALTAVSAEDAVSQQSRILSHGGIIEPLTPTSPISSLPDIHILTSPAASQDNSLPLTTAARGCETPESCLSANPVVKVKPKVQRKPKMHPAGPNSLPTSIIGITCPPRTADPSPTPEASRAGTPSSTVPDLTSEPGLETELKRKASALRKPRDSTRPVRISATNLLQTKIDRLAQRQEASTNRIVVGVQRDWIYRRMVRLQGLDGVSATPEEILEAADSESRELYIALSTEFDRDKSASKGMQPDYPEAERRIKAWAAERCIGLRELGIDWKVGSGLQQLKKYARK